MDTGHVTDDPDAVAEIEAQEREEAAREAQFRWNRQVREEERLRRAELAAEKAEEEHEYERENPFEVMKKGREMLEEGEGMLEEGAADVGGVLGKGMRGLNFDAGSGLFDGEVDEANKMSFEWTTPKEKGKERVTGGKNDNVQHEMGDEVDGRSSQAEKGDEGEGEGDSAALDATKAQQIRRQVEYYFSDENLYTDRFLLGKMKGRKNKPVPIGTIHQFKKMRDFQPFSAVVDALKESECLDVVKEGGKWCVKRKQPFIKLKDEAAEQETPKPPKPPKPTGFERWYADAPMTPAEAEEEEELYDEDRPFADRIETALQRYETKRRFNSFKRNVFHKWMAFGGIHTATKQFTGGLSKQDMESMTAAEISAARSNYTIPLDADDPDVWIVDFPGVAESFLSEVVPFYWFFESDAECRETTNVLRNFYNYLLHHDVCPEHATSILAARAVCDRADAEMHATCRATQLLPGAFNTAASAIFGGHYATLLDDDDASPSTWQPPASVAPASALTPINARRTVAFGLAACGDTLADASFSQSIARTEDAIGLEVIAVLPADAETRALYAAAAPDDPGLLGRLRCKPWRPLVFTPPDLPQSLRPAHAQEVYELLLEEELLQWCFVGMKLEATVRALSGGLVFVDEIVCVRCGFDRLLCNELLRGYRAPVWITREEHLAREARAGASGGVDEEAVGVVE